MGIKEMQARFTRYGQDTEEGRQGGAVGSGAATLSGGAR